MQFDFARNWFAASDFQETLDAETNFGASEEELPRTLQIPDCTSG
jgi:hypothetical protein